MVRQYAEDFGGSSRDVSERQAEGAGVARAAVSTTPGSLRLTVGTICCAPSAVEAPRPRPPCTSPVNKSLRAGYEHSKLDLCEISPVPTSLRDASSLVTVVYV